ncbi:MAG: lysophospholipid acyltransferase family protein [Ignavibacteria bacterium]|nr:lysophospholipid acyltransferase family protein [Ignavibacteria bacterium]MCC7158014.1 lysophospholipid acyltransferase family protein [Ignavibacteria bacterium]
MIKAKKNGLVNLAFGIYHGRLLKKHFYRIHLAGRKNLDDINRDFPVILYTNHSNWWDGFIAYQLTSKILKVDDYLMMDIDQMEKYRFFKYVGVFSVNRNDAKDALNTINYAADLLHDSKKYLWVFPQGILQPQDMRPIEFFGGTAKLAEKLGSVNLVPVSFRYEFLMEQRPEVFISIGEPGSFQGNVPRDLTMRMQNKLTKDLNELKEMVVNGNLSDFESIFTGKSSRNKTIDKIVD